MMVMSGKWLLACVIFEYIIYVYFDTILNLDYCRHLKNVIFVITMISLIVIISISIFQLYQR